MASGDMGYVDENGRLFVVGRDSRVTNNAVQIGDIETELKIVQ